VHVVLGKEAPRPGECTAFVVSEGECRFSIPEVGRYDVCGGGRIMVRPFPLAEPALVRLFLLGSAWAALLHQRGAFALHAGVTANGDGAVAFCGPPAAGKSSAVAWLIRRGHSLASDDLCRLELSALGQANVWPSTPVIKLSPEALDAGGWSVSLEGLRRELPGRKLHIPWEGARTGGPVPLRAIYILRWGEPAVRRMRGMEAVQSFLAAATYRPALLEPASELARHWRMGIEVARRIPIWELTRRRDWSSMDQVMEQLRLTPVATER
jgi:hypothetical protein